MNTNDILHFAVMPFHAEHSIASQWWGRRLARFGFHTFITAVLHSKKKTVIAMGWNHVAHHFTVIIAAFFFHTEAIADGRTRGTLLASRRMQANISRVAICPVIAIRVTITALVFILDAHRNGGAW